MEGAGYKVQGTGYRVQGAGYELRVTRLMAYRLWLPEER
jgi:hypothetical protein